jgi:GNAT superfamily N-acetyltransferase
MDEAPLLRRLRADDSLEDLTELLHRAYAPLLRAGMRFHASHQDAEVTRSRCERGECWVATLGGRVVGTITYYPAGTSDGTPWYCEPGVASIGQYAVEPSLQGRGIGRLLMDHAERRAREDGAREIACDTSERARALIDTYTRRGSRFIEHAQWDVTNYRSVILSKRLPEA